MLLRALTFALFPAQAGVILADAEKYAKWAPVPRASGGDPIPAKLFI